MESETQERHLFDLIPPAWFSEGEPRLVRIRAYQMARVTRADLPKDLPWFATNRYLVLLNHGPIKYLSAPHLRFNVSRDDLSIQFDQAEISKESQPSVHAAIVVPEKHGEPEARFHLDIAAGLLGVTCGRNAIFHLLFENKVDLATDQVSVGTPAMRNPLSLPVPDLSLLGLSPFARAVEVLASLDPSTRNRIHLALHWHEQAVRSPAHDEFLKEWIALEALAMEGTTNIRPLNEVLAASYEITLKEATKRFAVGRIFGLRSRIVHGGERLSIDGLLHEFLEGIFRDVLFAKLGLQHRGFAAAIAAQPEFDLRTLLHEAS